MLLGLAIGSGVADVFDETTPSGWVIVTTSVTVRTDPLSTVVYVVVIVAPGKVIVGPNWVSVAPGRVHVTPGKVTVGPGCVTVRIETEVNTTVDAGNVVVTVWVVPFSTIVVEIVDAGSVVVCRTVVVTLTVVGTNI